MLKLNSIMLGSENAKALAEFYEKVLEKNQTWRKKVGMDGIQEIASLELEITLK